MTRERDQVSGKGGEPQAGVSCQGISSRRAFRHLVTLSPCHLVIALVLALLTAAGWWARQQAIVPEPPAVPLGMADPEVAQAVQEARDKVRQAPHSAAAWGRLGLVFLAHHYLAEAGTCFTEAEQLDPSEPRWPYYHAVTLRSEDAGAALSKLQRAVELWGNGADEPRLWLAEMLLERGRFDEAEAYFLRVLKRDPGQLRTNFGLGRLAYQRGNLPAALAYLRRASASPYVRRASLTLLAEVHRQRNEPDEAARALREVARLDADPLWPDPLLEEVEARKVGRVARMERAHQLLTEKRFDEAEALLRAMVRDYPDWELPCVRLGRHWVQRGRPADAERVLREALKRAPNSAEAHFTLGVSLLEQRRPAEAEPHFRKLRELRPEDALAHFGLGHCLLQQGDAAAAEEEFRAAIRRKPEMVEAHLRLGELCLDSGRWSEVLTYAGNVLALNPSDEQARKLAARALSHLIMPLGL